MKNENLEELFGSLDFDIAEPEKDHQQRFREKLESSSRRNMKSSGVISILLPWMGIAAAFFIGFLLVNGFFGNQLKVEGELANVSPKMEETQNFYASVIEQELYRLEQQKNPATQLLIKDALNQLQILENDYSKLKSDLVKSGQDRRVIHAMISNFQKRIDLLNNVLEKANTINTLKNTPHEDNVL